VLSASSPEKFTNVDLHLRETSIAVVIPVFDDWHSLSLLLRKIDDSFSVSGYTAEIVAVDDGSATPFDRSAFFTDPKYENLNRLTVVELKRNLGHQRAIAIGLSYIAADRACDAVLVMDGDGEDDPIEAIRLIDTCRDGSFDKIVFGKRSTRSEGVIFRVFYLLYRTFYKALTGKPIHFGNFSVVPRRILMKLIVVSEVWNHYAAGILKAQVPYTEIATRRGKRLSGSPRMNFVSLVAHGLSAISVHGDTVGVRLLLGTCALIVLSLLGIITVVMVRFVTDLAIPGWATYASAMLLIILMQAVTMSLFFIFLVLNNRDSIGFIPERDYDRFISSTRDVFRKQ
jgi:hypothetical protein